MSDPSSSWQSAEAAAGWRPASGDLPDVNVWLALSYAQHPLHTVASRYWQTVCESGKSLWFSRCTMMGLVRVLTQTQAMGANAMPLAQAMKVYRQWITTPKVALLPDPPGLDSLIEQMLDAAPALPTRLWMDIRLAATAQCAGLRLVTFEREVTLLGLDQCLILPRV